MWTSSPRSGIRSTGIRTLVFRTEGLDAADVKAAFAFGESEGGGKRTNGTFYSVLSCIPDGIL
jgi:hypothetical protein